MRTEILDEHLASIRDSGKIGNASVAVLERLLGGRVEEADAVKVTDSGLLGDGTLHILDCRAGSELNTGRESLDGLLRCCSGGKGTGQLLEKQDEKGQDSPE